jgi:HEAT repeat protein
MNRPDDGFSLLRDEVDDPAIQALFEEGSGEFQVAVRYLIEKASSDDGVANLLIETLEASVEEFVDDTDASAWIAIILGEARAFTAIGALLRTFAIDDDETLQEAAALALLRIGPPALDALMEWLDEDPGRELRRAGYQLLGDAGIVDRELAEEEQDFGEQDPRNIAGDGSFVAHVREFLRQRIARERYFDATESSLEEAAAAVARLGDRESLAPLRDILKRDFRGMQPVIQDAIEQLEENTDGVPFVPTQPPWVDRYGWLFDDNPEQARVSRPPPTASLRVEGNDPDDSREVQVDGLDEETKLSCLYWGLGSTASGPDGENELDARRFVADPRDEEDPDKD